VDYISALDSANRGDLRDLVRLFARLEVVALRSELERPALPAVAASGAVDVAAAYVARLKALRTGVSADRATRSEELARAIAERLQSLLRELGDGLVRQFRELDPQAHVEVYSAEPPDERAQWWKAQIIRTAKHGGFFANLTGGTWWCYLRLTVLGEQFRYVTVIQKVGQGETGVLAFTVFAESVPSASCEPGGSTPRYLALLPPSQVDSVTFVYTDSADARWPEVAEAVDRTLAAAIAALAEGFS
jgi:hypothetical protein